jgi:hypothetical protein
LACSFGGVGCAGALSHRYRPAIHKTNVRLF